MSNNTWLVSFILLVYFVTIDGLHANNENHLTINLIADSLKENSNAVVRFSDSRFILKSLDEGIETKNIGISILNNNGLSNAHFIEYGNKYRTVKKFSAQIYNKDGIKIKTYKLSDVSKVKISDHLSTDWYINLVNITYPPTPFTIVYTYDIEWKNSIMFLPSFFPINNYNVAVEKSTYSISFPNNLDVLMYKSDPNNAVKIDTVANQNITYICNLSSHKSIIYEDNAPQLKQLSPFIYFAPKIFKYDNTEGSNESISSIGLWQYNLIKTQKDLTTNQKQVAQDITKNASTDLEKVKVLYEYIGNNTRYESIQLGIGGYQPIPASEVLRIGFGDCKGLSLLMHSMLEEIGIKSYFTVIKSDISDKYLTNNFLGFLSCNHAILQVPLDNDTLWLEMTNRSVPFGYIHTAIAGHDAIVIKEHGGEIVRLPEYTIEQSIDKQNATISIQPDLHTRINFNREFHVNYYNDYMYLLNLPLNKGIDFARNNIFLPHANISNFTLANNNNSLPSMLLKYDITIPIYGINTNNRLFIPVNPFRNKNLLYKTKKTRKNDLEILENTNYADTYSISIPENYVIESIPSELTISTKFGNFTSHFETNSNSITVYQTFKIFKGKWNVVEYNEFVEFLKTVEKTFDNQIIIKRNN